MTTIKICDIRSADVAAECVRLRVDYLGLHCIWGRPDKERVAKFRAIADVAGHTCGLVLVTRQTDVPTVMDMAGIVRWGFLQLHAAWEPRAVVDLRRQLDSRGLSASIIGVVEVGDGAITRIQQMEEVVDILLFDTSLRGGTGVRPDADALRMAIDLVKSKPWILAGGLSPANVDCAIRTYRPWGVDVQSGVERDNGTREKDPVLIRKFVESVRCAEAVEEN